MDDDTCASTWSRRTKRFSQEQFEALVAEALETLPHQVAGWLDNVAVMVAQKPTPDQLRQVGLQPGDMLLGLYEGTPKTRRGVTYGEQLPDRILIFQRPIERLCRTREEVRVEVRRTVLHEIGHHFGLDEDDLDGAAV